LTSDVLTFLTP